MEGKPRLPATLVGNVFSVSRPAIAILALEHVGSQTAAGYTVGRRLCEPWTEPAIIPLNASYKIS